MQTTQQLYSAGVSGTAQQGVSSTSATLTGQSAAALSFAAMEQMHMQNKWYSA